MGSIASIELNCLLFSKKLWNCSCENLFPTHKECVKSPVFHCHKIKLIITPNSPSTQPVAFPPGVVSKKKADIAITGDMGWKWPITRLKVDISWIFNCDWNHKGQTWSWSVRCILNQTGLVEIFDFILNKTFFSSVIVW